MGKKFYVLTAILVMFGFGHRLSAQFVEGLQSRLDLHVQKTSKEKVYVAFDRNTYVIGDHIWFHVFLMDSEGSSPGGLSNFVHVEFFDLGTGKVLAKRIVKVEDGLGQADVESLPTWNANIGVRAYTHHLLNYDQAHQFVGNLNFIKSSKTADRPRPNGLDVQFLPESGHLLDGVPNILAFKGLTGQGRSVHFKGKIRNLTTGDIIPLKTQFAGMGRVTIVPQVESEYRAEIEYLGKTYEFDLPRVRQDGFQLNCEHYDKRIKIKVSSVVRSLTGTTVVIHRDNQIVYSTEISSDGESEFIFDSTGLDEGVYQVSLFDNMGDPRAERMVYLNLDTTGEVNTDLQVSLSDGEGRTNLRVGEGFIASLSVFDAKYDNNPYQATIKDYLLVNSHMKGIVENPGFYFDSDIPRHVRNFALDLLMLTQGWSRFDWDAVLDDEKLGYLLPPEQEGLNIRLRTFVDFGRGDQRPLQTLVNLVQRDTFLLTKGKTYPNGQIYFNKDFTDTLNIFASAEPVVFQGRQTRDPGSISIAHEPIASDYLPKVTVGERYTPPAIYREASENLPFLESALNQINLKNVTVTAAKKKVKRNRLPPEYFERPWQIHNPDFVTRRKLVTDEERMMFNNPLDILTQMGITVGLIPRQSEEITPFTSAFGSQGNEVNSSAYPSLSGAGVGRITGQPLFLLDGVPIDPNYILNLSPFEIDFVDILLASDAAIYGLRGSNGVIAIYTKTGREAKYSLEEAKNEISFAVEGYYKSREFYTPKTNRTGKQNNGLPIPTLAFKTIDDETGLVSFTVPETSEDVVVKIEGLTLSGKPFVVKKTVGAAPNN